MAAPEENSTAVLQGIARHINCLIDDNRNTRRNALTSIRKATVDKIEPLELADLKSVFLELRKPLLKCFSDPVEKCRELSIAMIKSFLSMLKDTEEHLSYIIPVLVQRLGQQDIIEQSEEIRLNLVELLLFLVETNGTKCGVYVDDCVRILQRTIQDQFPDVKKESCACASLLAKSCPQYFYMQADSLVKPLLLSITHQHSKVRTIVVETIGTVLQYSNGKAVEDVVSHLAQRFFDQSPTVRRVLTKVIGHWLLELPDRYSYHPKLIPLLLTSLSDEQADIRELADGLWHDIGLKYERENEDDLKDKLDFQALPPSHYPPGIDRPNLGCRVLVNRHLSKVLPGLVRDLGDWVTDTRVKSAALLFWLLINAEEYVTQHIEVLLTGLYKACHDEDTRVVKDVRRCAELIGYFVETEIWKKLALVGLRQSTSYGVVMTIAAVIRGTPKESLMAHQEDLVRAVCNPDVCHTVEEKMHQQILDFCESLIVLMGSDIENVSQHLFELLVSVVAMQQNAQIKETADKHLESLAKVQGLTDTSELFDRHTKPLIDCFGDGINLWTNHSPERLIFDALLIEAGPIVGRHLDDVIPIIMTNLQVDKDPELRLKFFSLLSRLIMKSASTLDSEHRFSDFAATVVSDMILPNCVWKAGRTAGAIRTTAVSCLWAILQSGVFTKEKMEPILESVFTHILSLMEDDNQSTRLISCRVLTRTFDLMQQSVDQDRLHNMYPELLKRLDDSSDEIRMTMTKALLAYFDCFGSDYDVRLYRAHLEALYQGLLVHLDDPEQKVQEAVLSVLKKAAEFSPPMLMREVEGVKLKHRSTKYCDMLSQHAQGLGSKES